MVPLEMNIEVHLQRCPASLLQAQRAQSFLYSIVAQPKKQHALERELVNSKAKEELCSC